jgi:hypothetical protein
MLSVKELTIEDVRAMLQETDRFIKEGAEETERRFMVMFV